MPDSTPAPTPADGFEIRVKGRTGEPLRTAFPELTITVNPVETVLRAAALDQAGLYALLEGIQSLGLELIEIRKLPPRNHGDQPC